MSYGRSRSIEFSKGWSPTLALLLLLVMFYTGVFAANPRFRVDYQRKGPHGLPNRIAWSARGDTVVFRIESEFGIGSGSVYLAKRQWPKVVRFRLYLGGLESFTLSYPGTQLTISEMQVQARDRLGKPLDMRYLNQLPACERVGSYYEVTLPRATELPVREKIEVRWVDFYRG